MNIRPLPRDDDPESSGTINSEFYSARELKFIGFHSVGKNCRISRKASFYAIDGYIGDNVRIDDFCILKGRLIIREYVHIGAHNMISGAKATVEFKGCNVTGAYTAIYSGSDDHRADSLCGMVPPEYSAQIEGPITIGFGTVIGTHVVILPKVDIGRGAAVGAGSVVSFDIPDGGIVRPAQTQLISRRRDVDKIMKMGLRLLENHDGEP